MKEIITYLVSILCSQFIVAQVVVIRDLNTFRNIEKYIYSLDSKNHSSLKPYYFSDFKTEISDSLDYLHAHPSFQYKTALFKQNIGISLLPIYESFYGLNTKNTNDNMFFLNVGALIDFTISDKLGISYLYKTSIFELPDYLLTKDFGNPILNSYGKTYKNKNEFAYNHDFRITYSAFDFLKIELANSKNYFGDGYRSLLLSENSKNYPYFKIETQFLDIKYSCIWSINQSLEKIISENSIDYYYKERNKFSVFQYLDWKIGEKFSLGIFEAIISKNKDFFNFEYLNPVIFFRPVEFSLGSEDNALLGTNIKYNFKSNSAFYFQFIFDDIIIKQLFNDIKHNINKNYKGEYGWFANKWAMQIGVKTFDLFKIENLDFFTEINISRPYTYSHLYPEQNYSNYGQALAHPLGANFIESVTGLNYYCKHFNINLKLMYAKTGLDTINSHFGQNIFLPTMDGINQGWNYQVSSYYNTILQGNKTNIFTTNIEFSYFIKSNRNLSANFGVLIRNINPKYGDKQFIGYIYLGIRTNISKLDFLY